MPAADVLPSASRPPRRRAAAAVALIAGLVLLALAGPRMLAGVIVAPHASLPARLARGEPATLPCVDRAIAAHERALSIYENSRDRAHLGELYFAAAHMLGPQSGRGARLLEQAIAAHRRALAQSPARPYSWSQLAVALYGRDGGTRAFRAAFSRAIQSAPRTPQLVLAHAGLGLRTWGVLGPALRDRVRDQLAWAVTHFPRRLARRLPRALEARLALSLLSGRPVLRCRFAAAWQKRSLEGCAALGG